MPRRLPRGFAPGAPLDRHDQKILREAGFEPGYPLLSLASDNEADELQSIMHVLTCPQRETPFLKVGPAMWLRVAVPDGSGEHEQTRSMAVNISEVRRTWYVQNYWYLAGRLDWGEDEEHKPKKWYINRKMVNDCHVRVLLTDSAAFLQLIPIGLWSQLPPPTTDDELRWGDLSSRTLPPQPPS